jgi:hypothetical protein
MGFIKSLDPPGLAKTGFEAAQKGMKESAEM